MSVIRSNISHLETLAQKSEMAKIVYEGYKALEGDQTNQLNHMIGMCNILIEDLEKTRTRMKQMLEDIYQANMKDKL